MKKTIMMGILCCISIVLFVAAYSYWVKAKEILDSQNKIEAIDTSKVEAINFYEEYQLNGKFESTDVKEYYIDTAQYTLNKEFNLGSAVSKDEILCTLIENKKNTEKIQAAGVVTENSLDENGLRKIVVKDVGSLKACFYVPQKYCNNFSIGEEVTLKYNDSEYIAKISYISYELENIENGENSSKQLYMEAILTDSSGIYINADFTIDKNICMAENVKAVFKSAIHYHNEEPYINIVLEDGSIERKYVELGNSDETMVEIITDEVYVGDIISME